MSSGFRYFGSGRSLHSTIIGGFSGMFQLVPLDSERSIHLSVCLTTRTSVTYRWHIKRRVLVDVTKSRFLIHSHGDDDKNIQEVTTS